jgi:hypothetical protein
MEEHLNPGEAKQPQGSSYTTGKGSMPVEGRWPRT